MEEQERSCKLCNDSAPFAFQARVLYKYDISYFLCQGCGFLFSEDPYWLEDAYDEAINITDTGVVLRNLQKRDITSIILWCLFDRRSKFLDYAGGYGLFVRLMRDIGFDYFWDDKYCQNLLARGFDGQDEKFECVTAFECFEHFVDPVSELDRILARGNNLLLTTTILPDPVPQPGEWWYYGLHHGQHISFYSIQSLRNLAVSRGLNFYSNGTDVHLFARRRIPQILFKILVSSRRFGAAKIVRLFMKSKIWDDVHHLKATLKK